MPKKSSASKIRLNSFNDLFGLNDVMSQGVEVRNVMLDELFEFEGHPFKVCDNEKMEELTESVREHGVLVPGIARIRAKGGYEIIAGHSRKRACEKAGLSVMPMYIRNMSDDEATIVMVDSNIQREDILPSEKARAYKMKYDAMKHQGKKGNSLKAMGEESGESRNVVQRYIWLANLSDELLEMVDAKKLGFTQGVDISFLRKTEQEWLLNVVNKLGINISIRQSATFYPDLSSEWSANNLTLKPTMVTCNSNKVVWWTGRCGHEWRARIADRTKGHGCPYCAGKILAGFNDIATTNPEVMEEWSDKSKSLEERAELLMRNKTIHSKR